MSRDRAQALGDEGRAFRSREAQPVRGWKTKRAGVPQACPIAHKGRAVMKEGERESGDREGGMKEKRSDRGQGGR